MKFMLLAACVMGERLGAVFNDRLFIGEDFSVAALGGRLSLDSFGSSPGCAPRSPASPAVTTVAYGGPRSP